MVLNDEQKAAVGRWIKEGYGLSDIQKALSSEFGISMTYMDVRLLLLDADMAVKDKVVKKPAVEQSAEQGSGIDAAGEEDSLSPDHGSVSVDVDRITRPGAIVSGTVKFSDGKAGNWSLDQMGRLALDVGDAEYRPSEEDVGLFQQELKHALSQRGF